MCMLRVHIRHQGTAQPSFPTPCSLHVQYTYVFAFGLAEMLSQTFLYRFALSQTCYCHPHGSSQPWKHMPFCLFRIVQGCFWLKNCAFGELSVWDYLFCELSTQVVVFLNWMLSHANICVARWLRAGCFPAQRLFPLNAVFVSGLSVVVFFPSHTGSVEATRVSDL